MLRNAKQQQEFAQQEWLECANGMFTFHRTKNRDLYERVLRLHRTRQLKPSLDRMSRLWLRRVLETNPHFHTGSIEENAFRNSETLFSYLVPVVSLYQSGRTAAMDVSESINETAVQYGATGDKLYLDELKQAGAVLGGVFNQQCMVQIARLLQ